MKIHTANSFRILMVEQLREPLTLFWNLLAPIIVFLALNYQAVLNNEALPVETVNPYIAYTVLSIALYSFGIVLLNRREEGFFVSVTHTTKSFLNFIIIQWLSVYIIFLIVAITLIASFSLFATSISLLTSLSLLVRASIAYGLVSLFFVSIGCLPINLKAAYSISSFIIMGALLLFIYTSSIDMQIFSAYTPMLVNPLLLSYSITLSGLLSWPLLTMALFYLAIGAYCLNNFPKQPVFKRA